MRTGLLVVVGGISLLLATGTSWAHHAFSAEFDSTRPLKLHGTVTEWEMVNPHSWIHIDVKGDDGKVVPWMVEAGSPNSLLRLGFTKNSLPPGTELVIEGYQAKDRTNLAVGKNITFKDGKRLFLGGSANEVKDNDADKKK
jgi:Family of unknown function (DUF6152)